MRICVVTGTRAEYGLLKNLIYRIKKDKKLKLQLIVTGTHLSKKFGKTLNEIKKDKFKFDKKIDLNIKNDNTENITNSISKGISAFAKVFQNLSPKIIIILGDRYETLAAAIAAHYSRIPIAHLHGGEITLGSLDESTRHAITKLSHFHFVANEKYRKRIIQLGETPGKVFVVGGLGVDSIKNTKLLDKQKLEKKIGIKFKKRNLIINFNSETLNKFSTKKNFNEILKALKTLDETNLIFTQPNSDLDSSIIFNMIKKYVKKNKNAYVFTSLGSLKFYSCLKYVDGMIGNSSSGLLEMPTFKKGTINIGNRQTGRIMCSSIINTKPNKASILKSIKTLYSHNFKNKIKNIKNPYGSGGATKKIISILKKVKFNGVLTKKFYDI